MPLGYDKNIRRLRYPRSLNALIKSLVNVLKLAKPCGFEKFIDNKLSKINWCLYLTSNFPFFISTWYFDKRKVLQKANWVRVNCKLGAICCWRFFLAFFGKAHRDFLQVSSKIASVFQTFSTKYPPENSLQRISQNMRTMHFWKLMFRRLWNYQKHAIRVENVIWVGHISFFQLRKTSH